MTRQAAAPPVPARPALVWGSPTRAAPAAEPRSRAGRYQMPSSTFASSLAIVRGSQRGVQTRLMSTSLIDG